MRQATTPRIPVPSARSARRSATLAGALALALVAGCTGGGGGSTTTGPPSPAGSLVLNFGLRTDLLLSDGFPADALALDLSGDGIADIVEANYQSGNVTIAFGNPNGTFTTLFQIPCVGSPWRLATGDFDGDGMTDVAVTCLDDLGGQSAVQVILQGPQAVFSDGGSLILSSNPLDVAVAASSGARAPGDPDELFCALPLDGHVARVALDLGGVLQLTDTIDSSVLGDTAQPFSVAIVDLMGNGLADLVVGEVMVNAGALPDRVLVFPRDVGDPTQFLTPAPVLSSTFEPVVDSAGDVDGNSFEDLAVAQLGATDAFLLLGDGAGFSQSISIELGGGTSSLIFGDLDGDTLADVAATVLYQSSVIVRTATSPLNWGDPDHYNVGFLPRALGIFTLPTDPMADLLCSNFSDLSVLTGDSDGTFNGARGYPVQDGPISIDCGDLDGDGNVDAVVIDLFQQALSFLAGDGEGNLNEATSVPLVPGTQETPGSVKVIDLDGDDLPEVVMTIHLADEVRVLRNPGTIAGFAPAGPEDKLGVGPRPLGMDVADLNGDGNLDALVACSGDDTVQVLIGAGATLGGGAFDPQTPIPLPYRPAEVVCRDFDGDDDLDAAVTTGETDGTDTFLLILENDGAANFTVAATHSLASLSSSVDSADLDGDGLFDIVIAEPGLANDHATVLMNLGSLAFSQTNLVLGTSVNSVLIDDVDQDGALDVLATLSEGALRIALGAGDGSFPDIEPIQEGQFGVPFNTFGLCFEDLDGDMLPELVMAAPNAPLVWVGKNLSVPNEEP